MALWIVAVILGVLFSIRKLDVAKRQSEEFPNVGAEAFERWKRLEGSAYSLGSFACFFEVFVDVGLLVLLQRTGIDPSFVRVGAATSFLLWIVLLIVAGIRASRGRRLREELGIDLATRPAEPPGRSEDT